ncbi:filamentous hemagglutinin N-terminal domain-containing protein [Variovorax sp. dw_308]|uniref:two-partner secretion domain-containing protein n=1 Tax=Variovorax sp. dw_308 TaxID=2721546 RepID=UPI001C462CD1|nr:filamentous hemagglutinin N-terminal domain-containing protein [Variovorax sp. dw_308]
MKQFNKRPALRPLALSLVCMGCGSALAQIPSGFTTSSNNLSITGADTPSIMVTQGKLNTRDVATWATFSIGVGNSVYFKQPSPKSVILNRVLGGGESQIMGSLKSDGIIFLVNPSGVTFSKDSSVNVGGLVASTLAIDPADFLAGQYKFGGVADSTGKVTNDTNIVVGARGTVALVGGEVHNTGTINVAQGSIGLLSGRTAQIGIDANGDGLTTFVVSADAAKALVENTGTLQADGGRVNLRAGIGLDAVAQTVINQTGTVRAQSMTQRNGEIVLEGAGGVVQVGGTLDASAADAGSGGTIATVGATVTVAPTVSIDAHGGANGANGSWTLTADTDLRVRSPDETTAFAQLSTVDTKTIGNTLGKGTDVVLESKAVAIGDSPGYGVDFAQNSKVIKDTGGTATLTVNSERNITMENYSVIASSAGALNVDFNADSKGALEPPPLSTEMPRGGAILLGSANLDGDDVGNAVPTGGATIQTNGGNIRFYGQSDPDKGRAIGGERLITFNSDGETIVQTQATAGIELNRSTVSTCGKDQVSCTGGGSISMRGGGYSLIDAFNVGEGQQLTFSNGGEGVLIAGSTLTTGSGAMTIDGRGGIGATGIDAQSTYNVTSDLVPTLQSGTGTIHLVGDSRNWVAGMTGETDLDFLNGGTGIALSSTTIATGGNVKLEGTASDFSAVAQDKAFLANAAATGNTVTAGTGIELSDSTISAGKGQELTVLGKVPSGSFSVVNQEVGGPLIQPFGNPFAVDISTGSLTAEGGQLTIDGQGSSVRVQACCSESEGFAASRAPVFDPGNIDTLISTASTTGPGGNITIQGRNIWLQGSQGFEGDPNRGVVIDSSGVGKAGNINIHAIGADGPETSGVLAIDSTVGIAASANSAVGNAGNIFAKGDNTILAYGAFEAKGGASGGNGGTIETSGGAFDVRGITVDASAPHGTPGNWLIDPFNVTIAPGTGTATLPGDGTFTPITDSTIQDSDISNALNGGTDVTINTGALAAGAANQGNITVNGAQILYTGTGTRTFTLNANRSIQLNFGTAIASADGGGPLNVVLNADANNGAATTGLGGSVNVFNSQIYSNGGSVTMKGAQGNQDFGNCVICIAASKIDTRAGNTVTATDGETGINTYSGGNDANPGGNVSLIGRDSRTPTDFQQTSGAVLINGSVISASTGNVDVLGTSTVGSGVVLTTNQVPTGIFTTSGGITLTGVGSYAANSFSTAGHGVQIDAQPFSGATATLQSADGNITVSGLRQAGLDRTPPDNGVYLGGRSLVTTTGTGNISITGETKGAGAGVLIEAATPPLPQQEIPGDPGALVSGNNVVVLRAANDGTTDALSVGARDEGPSVIAGTVLNLRPGGVDVAGPASALVVTPVDRTANPITLGGAAANGFAISADTFARMQAPTIVAGSNAHAGNIDVVGPLNFANLTLQNGGGGNITLNAPVVATQLGLISGGNITQTAGAPITAGKLLALSSGGDVLLDNPANNVSTDTVGGGAAGRFTYVDADSVAIGAVTVTGFDAAGNLPQPVASTSMAADQVLVRTLTGDLVLAGNVSSTTSTDLVAAATFQNPGNFTISGAPWRVWANTWVGETRGGLAGSGPLPNYYHCAYLGLCTVTVSTTDNHFIYAQQPTAVVAIANASRVAGTDNPPFVFSVSGLMFSDSNAAFSGALRSAADRNSPPGVYTIDGVNFVSPAGYAFTVTPGRLTVTEAPPPPPLLPPPPNAPPPPPALRRTDFSGLPKPDVVREEPTTYVYDRNLGQAPICLAGGALDGDRADQGGDVLAREWSRVRSRPNLLNCVNTDRRNGCADF